MVVESWASNMPGTFDEEVRAALMSAQGDTQADKMQNARDMVARRNNVAAGNGMSTAWPNNAAASPAQAGPAPTQQSNVPVPTARPSNVQSSIDEQVADVPTPTARPNPAAMETGDASVLEAMLSKLTGAGQQQTAQSQTIPNMLDAIRPQQGPQAPAPNVAAEQGGGPSGFGMLQQGGQAVMDAMLALGGAAGLYTYLNRAKLGDENAARTLQTFGIDANSLDVSQSPMDFGTGQGGGTTVAPAQSGQQTVPQQQGGGAPMEAPAQKTQQTAPTQERIAPRVNDAPIPAPMQEWIKGMQNSVPKVKPKVKVKVK